MIVMLRRVLVVAGPAQLSPTSASLALFQCRCLFLRRPPASLLGKICPNHGTTPLRCLSAARSFSSANGEGLLDFSLETNCKEYCEKERQQPGVRGSKLHLSGMPPCSFRTLIIFLSHIVRNLPVVLLSYAVTKVEHLCPLLTRCTAITINAYE